jgi:integrase/recombinase XerD
LGKQYTPHSIRRSHATHMLLNGANPKMVMMQLGHTKVETTFRYLQLSIERNRKIYDKYY